MTTTTMSAALFSTSLFLGLAVGCGTTEAPAPDEMPGAPDAGPAGDTEAPAIAETSPADGAAGIETQATIEVRFSEPMNRASVEAAYASVDLPASAVSFVWNAESTRLVVTPAAGLAYAEGIGNEPTMVAARSYTVEIGASAADLAGNTLGETFQLSFATRRRMSTTAPLVGDLSRSRINTQGTILSPALDLGVGDTSANVMQRAFVTFDVSQVPTGVEIESARFSARQLAPLDSPYALGGVTAYHLHYATIDDTATALPISIPGVLSADAIAESKSIEVTAQVADDLAQRVVRLGRSQYRLQFDTATDNDSVIDRAVFAKGTFEMALVYLAD